jgi:hypothetical protein
VPIDPPAEPSEPASEPAPAPTPPAAANDTGTPGAAATAPTTDAEPAITEPETDAVAPDRIAPQVVEPEIVEPAVVEPDVAPAAPRLTPQALPSPPPKIRRCENCGTPLLGEHCYACGQPTRGLIRQFSTILGDFFDTVFNIDSRVFRTLGPLLVRPGRLSLEYFHGHRVRYVSPVRLFVFLSILAFLAAQWSTNINGDGGLEIDASGDTRGDIDSARTPEQVIAMRDRAIEQFEKAKREGANVPGLAAGMDAAAREIRAEADARLKELEAEARTAPKAPVPPGPPTPPTAAEAAKIAARPTPAGVPPAPGEGPPPGTGGDGGVIDERGKFNFNGRPWDAKTNPVHVDWLPAAANEQLNEWIGRAAVNVERLKKDEDKNWIKDGFLGVVPTVLIVLLPLFAVLLKVMYLFKRRLYMEHLVVALHSHAFLCLVLLLQSGLAMLEGWLATPGGLVAGAFDWVEGVLWAWIPLYLLLMQKRVYGQGWIATLFKFGIVGMVYFFMLVVAGVAAFFVTLVRA